MATAEELIASLSESVSEHTHKVTDSDTYFIIDPVSRQITNTAASKNVLMQYDHDSERFTFELPRYIEGHDMMLCNRVKVYYNNVDSVSGVESGDTYDVDDLRVDSKNPNVVLCSWLISRNATMYPGVLSFIVHYACVDEQTSELVYEWYSDIYYDIEIKPGRNNGEASVIEYTDILEQWRSRLFGVKDSLITDIQDVSQVEQAEITAKGAETLASIPEDYTTTHEMADEALRRKADAIIMSAEGTDIFLNDSSDCNLVGLKIYGRTDQIQTTGKNLLVYPYEHTTKFMNGISFIDNGDGSITINGTATTNVAFYFDSQLSGNMRNVLLGKEVILSGAPSSASESTYRMQVWNYDKSGINSAIDTGDGATFTFSNDTGDYNICVLIYSGQTVPNVTFRPMIRLATVSDDSYEPYSGAAASPSPTNPQDLISVENPTVTIYGKNICPMSAFDSMTNNGVSNTYDSTAHRITVNADTALSNFTGKYCRPLGNTCIIGQFYTISFDIRGTAGKIVSCGWDDNRTTITLTSDFKRYSSTKLAHRTDEVVSFYTIATGSGGLASGEYFEFDNVQIEFGTEATDFNEYKEPQALSFARTLHGIPVNQNGNYTDPNGQQWICDEIDFERGKLIQRVVSLTLDGSQTFGINNYQLTYYGWYVFETYVAAITGAAVEIPVMSNKFPGRHWSVYTGLKDGVYATAGRILINFGDQTIKTVEELTAYLQSNPIDVLYERDNPVEYDLTAAELEAFKALVTNATDTAIVNDTKAVMSVKYIADLERYIWKNVSYKRARFDLQLKESSWVESSDGRYYTQLLDIDARPNSEINLHPTASQQVSLILDGIAMFIANENGVVTAYAIGGTPGRDITIPATETVVVYE